MDKTTKTIIISAFVLMLIWGTVYFIIINNNKEKMLKEYTDFTRTYNILNIADSNDDAYVYITIRAFQDEEVDTVKINKNLNSDLQVGNSYEFVFDYKGKEIEDNIESIFNNMNLKKITLTEATGLDQINDSL